MKGVPPAMSQQKRMESEPHWLTASSSFWRLSLIHILNTADAIAAVFELVKFANTEAGEGSSKAFAGALLEELTSLADILGFTLEKKDESLDEEVERLIAERQAARKAKNFARADEIRAELLAKNIVLEDTREGVKWKRV